MKVLANILWFIFGGLISGIIWGLLGIILCITIIGIPFGVQCFKAAKLMFAPFGKAVRVQFDEHPVANLLWVIFIGWELALGYLVCGIILCVTIIGIPCGIQVFKFMKLAALPFGADILSKKK